MKVVIKKKPKRSKCYCETERTSTCGDCDKPEFLLDAEQVEDVLSALSFFASDYPDRKGSAETRKAMKNIADQLWKSKRSFYPNVSQPKEKLK